MSKILSGSPRLVLAVWMLAAVFPLILSAQDPAAKDNAQADKKTASEDPGPLCKGLTRSSVHSDHGHIQGLIVPPKQAKSDALDTAQMWLANKGTSERILVPLSKCEQQEGSSGFTFLASDVKPGDYEITLMAGKFGVETRSVTAVAGNSVRIDFQPVEPDRSDVVVLLVVGVLFLTSIWLARWHNIAIPNRRVLLSRTGELKARVIRSSNSGRDDLVMDLGSLEQTLKKRFNPDEFLFWSRGLETAGWKLLHRVEVAIIPDTSSAAEVDARLVTTAQRLADFDKQAAKNIASRIQEGMAKADFDGKKQLLKEALNYSYDASDTEFDALTSWQNKAFWLTLTGAMLAGSLAATVGHSTLFLAGAAGGFLSRLMRQLKRADVPTDYGASWSTLFLSPVSGALAGWFGIVLVMMLSDPRVGILAGPLAVIQWDSPTIAPTLAAAFALGFSERLFDGIMTQLEESIDKKKADSDKVGAQPATIPPPPTQPAQGPTPGTAATSLDALHVGDVATVSLDPASLVGVTGVDLKGVSLNAEITADKVDVGTDKVTFTIPAQSPPGKYSILLVSSDKRTDISKDLTILTAA